MRLQCKQCGAKVVSDGTAYRYSCEHVNGPIIANMTATAYGESSLAAKKTHNPLERLIRTIIKAIKPAQ